jgi:hypothetical protein
MINSHPLYRLSYQGISADINLIFSAGQAIFLKKVVFLMGLDDTSVF